MWARVEGGAGVIIEDVVADLVGVRTCYGEWWLDWRRWRRRAFEAFAWREYSALTISSDFAPVGVVALHAGDFSGLPLEIRLRSDIVNRDPGEKRVSG